MSYFIFLSVSGEQMPLVGNSFCGALCSLPTWPPSALIYLQLQTHTYRKQCWLASEAEKRAPLTLLLQITQLHQHSYLSQGVTGRQPPG